MKTLAFSRAMCAAFALSLICLAPGVHAEESSGTIGGSVVEPPVSLAITGIDTLKSSAAADGVYADGWAWLLHLTIPANETLLKLKFADWSDGSSAVAVANNMRFFSPQSSDAANESSAVAITSAGAYGTALTLDPAQDLDSTEPGRQISLYVEEKIPEGSAAGSYSASYGIDTEATPDAPPASPITVEGNDMSTTLTYNSNTPASSYGTFTLKFDVTAGDDDIYIPRAIATSSASASAAHAGAVIAADMAASTTSSTVTASLTTTADTDNANYYVVHAGDTETFTATMTIDPTATGDYEAGLDEVKYSLNDIDLNSLQTLDVDQNDSEFHTDPLHIPNS